MSFEHPGDDRRCDHCNARGHPYAYHGQQFSGLIAYRGDRICPRCAVIAARTDAQDMTPHEQRVLADLIAADARRSS